VSIYAYVGLPGSGKSYGVVANQIVPALKLGRTVVTNIPLHLDKMRADFPVNDDQVRDFPVEKILAEPELIEEYCKPGDVVVIDELWRLFPAGQRVDKVPEQFKSFLAEHRHRVDTKGRAMQIVFVTQGLDQVANFARSLVEQTFVHTKLGFMGASGSYKCEIFNKCVTGPNPSPSQKIRTVLGKYSPNVYQYYKSHTMSESDAAGADETVVDSRANIWKRPIIWVAGAFVLVGAPLSVHALTSYFSPETHKKSAALASGVPVSSPLVPARDSRVIDASKPIEKVYRVSVVLSSSRPDHAMALLEDGNGESVWIPAADCMFERMQWRCRYKNKWWVQSAGRRDVDADRRPAAASALPLVQPAS
jgi:zona occludens toxin